MRRTALRRIIAPQVTRLTPAQFAAVTNLEFLGVPVFKRKGAGGLFFGRKRKRNVRKVGFCGSVTSASSASSVGRFLPFLCGITYRSISCGRMQRDIGDGVSVRVIS